MSKKEYKTPEITKVELADKQVVHMVDKCRDIALPEAQGGCLTDFGAPAEGFSS